MRNQRDMATDSTCRVRDRGVGALSVMQEADVRRSCKFPESLPASRFRSPDQIADEYADSFEPESEAARATAVRLVTEALAAAWTAAAASGEPERGLVGILDQRLREIRAISDAGDASQ